MRNIKFRAIGIETGKWIYGSLVILALDVPSKIGYFISTLNAERIKVNPKTIGQYTNFKDKNGNDIYEGDYMKKVSGKTNKAFGKMKVVWHGAGFAIFAVGKYQGWLGKDVAAHSEVVGNIYENSGLLDVPSKKG